jgi:hypothetical protein
VQLQVNGDGVAPQPPYKWTLGGSLPQGLSLSQSGLISGTPYLPQTASFTISVLDANYASSGGRSFELTVGTNTPLDSTLVPLGTNALADMAATEQQVNGTVALVTYLAGGVQCLPSTLNTLLTGAPPSCFPPH